LQNTKELHTTATQIGTPKPDPEAHAQKRFGKHFLKEISLKVLRPYFLSPCRKLPRNHSNAEVLRLRVYIYIYSNVVAFHGRGFNHGFYGRGFIAMNVWPKCSKYHANERLKCQNVADTMQNGRQTLPNVANTMQNAK